MDARRARRERCSRPAGPTAQARAIRGDILAATKKSAKSTKPTTKRAKAPPARLYPSPSAATASDALEQPKAKRKYTKRKGGKGKPGRKPKAASGVADAIKIAFELGRTIERLEANR